MGEMIQLETGDGETFQAYAAGPADADRAVMLLHEWWGLMPHNKTWADRLAELGYRTLVVDLYDGRVTDDAEQAGAWMREIDQVAADRKLLAAIDALQAEGRKIATYGCSFGGKESLHDVLGGNPGMIRARRVAFGVTDSSFIMGSMGSVVGERLLADRRIPLISATGSAKRLDPTKIEVSTIWKTHGDRFASKLRYELKKRRFSKKYPVIFSSEPPHTKVKGSFMAVTAAFGLTMCSVAVKTLMKK